MSTQPNSTHGKRALVIYHANCDDGFGAAWAFHQLKEQDYFETFYHPAKYGEPFPNQWEGTADDVFIVDFSFPYSILVNEAKKYNSITQLDHHKSAWLDFCVATGMNPDEPNKDVPYTWTDYPVANLGGIWDMNRSGAMMTWDYFMLEHGGPTPLLISYIQDNDLWRFKFPETKPFISALRSYPQTFETWDKLNDNFNKSGGALATFCDEGETILRYYNKQLHENLNSTKRKIVIDGKEGLVANLPAQYASDAGNILAKESGTFGATYFTSASGDTVFSLRSVGAYDVSLLAKQFGGGGHKNAAGFKLFSPLDSSKEGVTLWSVSESPGVYHNRDKNFGEPNG